jgi:hypothetical protein
MYCAGAAKSGAAAKFGAGQTNRISEHPQERGFGLNIEVEAFAVDLERNHRRASPLIG